MRNEVFQGFFRQPSHGFFPIAVSTNCTRRQRPSRPNAILRKVAFPFREGYGKRAAAAFLTGCADVAVGGFDGFRDRGQSDPFSFLSAPARSFHTMETVEQTRTLFQRNSNPGIADLQLNAVRK